MFEDHNLDRVTGDMSLEERVDETKRLLDDYLDYHEDWELSTETINRLMDEIKELRAQRDQEALERLTLADAIERMDYKNPAIRQLIDTVQNDTVEMMAEVDYYNAIEELQEILGWDYSKSADLAMLFDNPGALMDEAAHYIPILKTFINRLEEIENK